MISKMPEDDEKFALLDKLFRVLSLDDMTQLLGQDIVIGKLKGLSDNLPGPVSQLVSDAIRLENELISVKGELSALKSDFSMLLRCLARPQFDIQTSNDFTSLKQRHSIY